MSFQAYLDGMEKKSGRTPQQLLDEARERGLDAPPIRADAVASWLNQTYGIGRGHAMALVHVMKHGPVISAKHVGTTGTHRDDSQLLRLDGVDARQ